MHNRAARGHTMERFSEKSAHIADCKVEIWDREFFDLSAPE